MNLDLPSVCTQFGAVRYYSGIVELALTAAQRRDQQALALHYYKNGEPPEDTQGRQGYVERWVEIWAMFANTSWWVGLFSCSFSFSL